MADIYALLNENYVEVTRRDLHTCPLNSQGLQLAIAEPGGVRIPFQPPAI